jgi:CRP-like cAMP-binding protein/membrane protein YdbS with pleckstrin-like domain
MALNASDAARVQSLLAVLPLAKAKPNFIRDLTTFLERRDAAQGETIYDPGYPVGYMYLMGEGKVIQSLGTSGQLWFQKEIEPGEFFGQRGLFSGQHETQVIAHAPSVLYRLSAVNLRALLDRYPEFQEVLLKEDLATRLRGIPILEPLRDSDIRWLAELVKVVDLPAGQDVPVDTQPGLWIIDRGQVAVEGPAAQAASASLPPPTGSSAPQGRAWRLSSGNFFTALQQGMAFGGASAATVARTALPTRLLYLAARHFNRLIGAFPEIRPIVSAPLDIVGNLSRVPALQGKGMTPEHLASLAEIAGWSFVPVNQNITTQGTVGYSFIQLVKGGALVSAVDDRGHRRPVHMLQPGDAYGLTSLLSSKPRDATVRAVTGKSPANQTPLPGAEVLDIDRRDLDYEFSVRPDLWHSGVFIFDQFVQTKHQRQRFDWLEEGETVIWDDRPHWLWIVLPYIVQLLLMLGMLIGLGVLLSAMTVRPQNVLLTDVVIAAVIWVPILWYTYINYRDDNYILTPRRVSRRLRQLPLREERISAPLSMVQDVSSDAGFWGRLFGYGTVSIRTAAKEGAIEFAHCPNPDLVRDLILSNKAQALIAARGYTKERLRRSLIDDLHMALAVPDMDAVRALGDADPLPKPLGWQRVLPRRRAKPRTLPARRTGPPVWLVSLLAPLPASWRRVLLGSTAATRPAPQPLTGAVVWRKHWMNFLLRAGLALLSFTFVLFFGIAMFSTGGFGLGLSGSADLVWVLAFIGTGFWLWYRAVDYWNDQYIVTDDKLIDIEKKPLALSTKQRESSLEVIQTVDSDQPSIWSRIFNYGNVRIRTAAADEGFIFYFVPGPMLVQNIVFQKWNAYRRRQEERNVEERRRSMAEGLQVYHELWEDSQRSGRP